MTMTREGMVAFRGYRTWYQIVGELHSVSGKQWKPDDIVKVQ
jgi:hypothetical protein